MKRLACIVALSVAGGTAALAADLPPPGAPAAYIPVALPYPYDWSGFYIGGNLGAGFTNSDSATDTFGSTFGTTATTSFLSSARRSCSIGFPIAKTPST
jgi:outer membrane immunogenic protein